MATIIKKGATKAEIVEKINSLKKERSKKDLLKLSGSLKLDVDPVVFQKKLRNEWK
jgi:hypothetical protein